MSQIKNFVCDKDCKFIWPEKCHFCPKLICGICYKKSHPDCKDCNFTYKGNREAGPVWYPIIYCTSCKDKDQNKHIPCTKGKHDGLQIAMNHCYARCCKMILRREFYGKSYNSKHRQKLNEIIEQKRVDKEKKVKHRQHHRRQKYESQRESVHNDRQLKRFQIDEEIFIDIFEI